jgi:hypothetical protein
MVTEENMKESGQLEDPGMDGGIRLNWFLKIVYEFENLVRQA